MTERTPDAKRYLTAIVRPTLTDARKHPREFRYLVIACTMLYHLKDYIALQLPAPRRAEEELRAADNEAFEVVRTIATAAKHGRLRDDKKFPHLPYDIEYHAPSFAGEMFAGHGFVGDTKGGYAIIFPDGSGIGILHCADQLLAAYLKEFGDILGPP